MLAKRVSHVRVAMLALPVLLAALGSEGSSPPAYVNTAEKLGGVKGTDLTDLQGTKVIGGKSGILGVPSSWKDVVVLGDS